MPGFLPEREGVDGKAEPGAVSHVPPGAWLAHSSTASGQLLGVVLQGLWETLYEQEFLYAGPLFTHQRSHIWVDFRSIQDAVMREKGIDYFETSRRATYVQQKYAIDYPLKFEAYDRDCWGITASEGLGPRTMRVKRIERAPFNPTKVRSF